MKRFLNLTLLAILWSLSGCSKALNADRGVSLVAAYVKQQKPTVPLYELTSILGSPQVTRGAVIPGMKRLLDGGYIQEQTVKMSYPDLTGSYEGLWPISYVGNKPSTIRVVITVNPDNRPPFINASYSTFHYMYGDAREIGRGVCSGMQETTFWLDCRSLTLVYAEPKRILINSHDSGQTAGQFSIQDGFNTRTSSMTLQGVATNRTIDQEKYVYSWSSKFPSSILVNNRVLLENISIEGCANLLLNAETSASCNLKWRSNLDAPRKALFGKDRLEGTISASFGKQPDGNWLVTNATSPTGSYSVYQ